MPEVGSLRDPVTRRYLLIAATLTGLGAGGYAAFAPAPPAMGWWWTPVVACGIAVAELPTVRVRVFGRTLKHSPSSWVVLVLMLNLPPAVVGLGAAAGVLIASIVLRSRLLLAMVNGAQILAGTALYFAVGSRFGLDFSGAGWSLFAVLAMVPVSLWVTDVSGYSLVTIARGERVSTLWSPTLVIALGLDLCQALLIGLAAVLIDFSAWMVVPIGLVVGLAVMAYRSYFRVQSDNESFRRLHGSTRAVTRTSDSKDERSRLLLQALDLIEAETIELYLRPGGLEGALLVRTDRDRQYVEELPGSTEAAGWWSRVVAEGSDGAEATIVECDIVVPLAGADGVMGAFRLTPQFGHPFTDTDRRLVDMFANHAAVALQNSQLVEQLRHDLLHDRLTSLPNRVMFDLQVRAALAKRGESEDVAVMLLDLDEFKEINDTLSHDVGDELLVMLGERVAAAVDEIEGAVAARLGGDEFAVLVPGCTDDSSTMVVAERIRAAVSEPLELHGIPVDVQASLGVSVAPRDSEDASALVQRADVSMYIAKRQHRGVVIYDSNDDPYSPKRLSLAADLRGAVDRGEIDAHFQPEIDVDTLQVVGCEALARWTHPAHGNVFPDQFIPIAEQSGLIRDLTYQMLEQSLVNIRRWRSLGHDLRVAVNLSVRCLNHRDIVEQLTSRIDRSGVDPDRIVLEVTEGTVMDNPELAIRVLTELREYGVSLSIDDFGMGISSLSQIKRLPVQQVKVDREFVKNIVTESQDVAIVGSVVHLGHRLGMEVVAEGVEDVETFGVLRSLGIDTAQGWLFAKAMPEPEFFEFVRTYRPPAGTEAPAELVRQRA